MSRDNDYDPVVRRRQPLLRQFRNIAHSAPSTIWASPPGQATSPAYRRLPSSNPSRPSPSSSRMDHPYMSFDGQQSCSLQRSRGFPQIEANMLMIGGGAGQREGHAKNAIKFRQLEQQKMDPTV